MTGMPPMSPKEQALETLGAYCSEAAALIDLIAVFLKKVEDQSAEKSGIRENDIRQLKQSSLLLQHLNQTCTNALGAKRRLLLS